jgi:hypothetical protein
MSTYSELLESLESNGRCLLCGGDVELAALKLAVDTYPDSKLLDEGAEKAESEADFTNEDDILDGTSDFGDQGEEDEDVL